MHYKNWIYRRQGLHLWKYQHQLVKKKLVNYQNLDFVKIILVSLLINKWCMILYIIKWC